LCGAGGGVDVAASAKPEIRIEEYSRWDALDLVHHLPNWSWYLVSQGGERWDVVVRVDQRPKKASQQLMHEVQEWANRREVDSIVHLDDADVSVHSAGLG